MTNFYSEDELNRLREQKKRGSEMAKEAIRRTGGIALHPRIQELKDRQNGNSCMSAVGGSKEN